MHPTVIGRLLDRAVQSQEGFAVKNAWNAQNHCCWVGFLPRLAFGEGLFAAGAQTQREGFGFFHLRAVQRLDNGLILFCIQSNINNPIKTGEGLDLGG